MSAPYRRVFTDRRGRRVASGFVVVTTNHPAAAANGAAMHRGFELDNGVLTLRLPANTYQLHAQLRSYDGEEWVESTYVTLEDQ